MKDVVDVIESLEAPWGMRIEHQLHEMFVPGAQDPISVSRALSEKVRELGLQPYVPPEPLPVIEEEDVKFICWLAIDV